jgi:hypothetical protein
MSRSLLSDGEKRVRMLWGTLSMLIWAVLGLGIAVLFSLLHMPIVIWMLSFVVAPAVLIPFAAGSAQWGLRLPWRRILQVQRAWRWWLGVLLAALGLALVNLLVTVVVVEQTWAAELKLDLVSLLEMGIWILLLGWFALLFDRQKPRTDEALKLILGQTESHSSEETVEKPPLPESE